MIVRSAFAVLIAAGTEKIPLDGLEPPFTLTASNAPADSLPKAHTCFNQLVCFVFALFVFV